MDKEEFEERLNILSTSIYGLYEEYISSNQKFAIGERVRIVSPDHIPPTERKNLGNGRYAYVHSYKLNWQNDVEPVLLKERKDGKPSKKFDFLRTNEHIEKINN